MSCKHLDRCAGLGTTAAHSKHVPQNSQDPVPSASIGRLQASSSKEQSNTGTREQSTYPVGEPSSLQLVKLAASEESFVTAENARSPPGFAGPPGFVKASENDKVLKSEDRVAEWIKANNTEDELPDLESPFDAETEEEEDTGFGKSNTRCSSMSSSTIGSEGYHSFGAAQVSFHQQCFQNCL